jgi:hypothetical protein
MKYSLTGRSLARLLTLFQLLLGFAVVLWGAGYKASLYFGPASGMDKIPAAKLLTNKERLIRVNEVRIDSDTPKFISATSSELIFACPNLSNNSWLPTEASSSRVSRSHLLPKLDSAFNYFASRPPPFKTKWIAAV